MAWIDPCPLPERALLNRYCERTQPEAAGTYTDCYSVTVHTRVALPEFVFAFYTTPVFKLERVILKHLVSRPSTDTQARQLADGSIDAFAAWTVEDRTHDQLLMCDLHARTRSWFMLVPTTAGASPATRLLFGSAVLPVRSGETGEQSLGRGYAMLLGFHKVYSKVLLHSARRRLEKLHHRALSPSAGK